MDLDFDEIEPFSGLDYCEDLLRDIDLEVGLTDLYDSIQRDVEDCEEEEIAQKVLTGLLEDAASKLTVSPIYPSSPSHSFTSTEDMESTSSFSPSPSTSALVPVKNLKLHQDVTNMPKSLYPSILWKVDMLECLFEKYTYKVDDVNEFVAMFDQPQNLMINFLEKMGDEPWEKTVLFLKSFDGFSNISEDDQVTLIQTSLNDIGIVTNAMFSDREGKYFIYQDKKNQTAVIDIDLFYRKMDIEKYEIVSRHKQRYYQVLQSCLSEWRLNKKLMLLLCGVALFNPDKQKLKDRCLVWRIQEFFYDLLRQYLAVLYPREADARLAFVGLIGFLAGVRECGKMISMKDYYDAEIPFVREWVDEHSSPLTRELFGLTQS